MKRIENIDSYFELVNHANKENAPTFTNCYLYRDKVQKLIMQGRFFYEEVNGGIFLFVDEKEYYQAYYYLNAGAEWKMAPKEKDVVIKNIYIENKKNKKLKLIEEKLNASGFYLFDQLGQIEFEETFFSLENEKIYNVALKIMTQRGFSIVEPDRELIPQIREMQKNISTIPIYQIPYLDDEEIIELGKEKRFICVVEGEKKKLCAIKVFVEENSYYGYFAVKEEYQMMNGIAVVLSGTYPNSLEEKKVKRKGWIVNTNAKSIRYHKSLGCHWTGRYTDEWILNAE